MTTDKPERPPLYPDNIPEALRVLERFVVWSWEPRGGKWDKPPRQTNGRLASTKDPATWCDFDTAVAAYRSGRCDGIGLVLPDDVTGVDLDDVRDPQTGEFCETARMMLAVLPTYAEVSPSGTGVKLLAFGGLSDKLPKVDHRKGVELYDGKTTNRYFTITGNILPGDRHRSITGQRDGLYALQTLLSDPLDPQVVFHDERDPERRLKAVEAVRHLADQRTDSYQDWMIVGMALKAIEDSPDMLAEWIRFSERSPKFDGPDACARKWESFQRRDGVMVGLGALLRMAREDGYDPDHYQTRAVWADSFLITPITRNYLIENMLVENEPAVIGGASKTLKTSIVLDMGVSLGAGVPFLGMFPVKKPIRTMLISGESGESTIQESLRAICDCRNIEPAALQDYLALSFRLPYLDGQDADSLVRELIDGEFRVVVIDPLYLAFRVGDDASNIYKMGERLGRLSKLLCGSGITAIILHHFRKQGRTYGEPPELEDLSQSGVGEYTRQFVLLKRRSPYQYDGNHSLWFNWGGSAGHQGTGILEVFTGTRELGITWRTTFRTAAEQKRHEQNEECKEIETLIVDAVCREPGIGANELVEALGRRKDETLAALKRLAGASLIDVTIGPRGKRQHYLATGSRTGSGGIKN